LLDVILDALSIIKMKHFNILQRFNDKIMEAVDESYVEKVVILSEFVQFWSILLIKAMLGKVTILREFF
jgi:hypothetical protein